MTRLLAAAVVVLGFVRAAAARPVPVDLKRLSIEELMQLDVTSVSRRSERAVRTALMVAF